MSPRPGPRRGLVAIRLSDTGLAEIDKLAAERGVSRSEQIRLMLAYSVQRMPKTWVPKA